ncbi:MAG: hypothetical protein QY311_00785 [Candidatus Paceibacterota bacterium]|nr:MAG: hypothetical protein QY311_00785 [Candidatus Paceibacterota bacterium]
MSEETHVQLEQDIRRLEGELAKKRATRDSVAEQSTAEHQDDHATLREVVREQIVGAPAPVSTPAHGPAVPLNDEQALQVQSLVQTALSQGLDVAVAAARETNNPAIIDALHDALADVYWKEMLQRGFVKAL